MWEHMNKRDTRTRTIAWGAVIVVTHDGMIHAYTNDWEGRKLPLLQQMQSCVSYKYTTYTETFVLKMACYNRAQN